MSESGSESSYSEEDEESESETEEAPKAKRRRGIAKPNKPEFTCHYCKDQFPNQCRLKFHIKTCKKRTGLNQCMWCGLHFTNRGNLASHAFHIHGDSSYKSLSKPKPSQSLKCNVCDKYSPTLTALRYHIRKTHFNLKAKIPHAEVKKVNQIWFEKVLNSDKIVEIKKTSPTTLILRCLDENSGIMVKDVEQKVIDLTSLYPLGKNSKVICEHCNKEYVKRDLRKHIRERHMNLKMFSCNNCQRMFKRSYQYLQHQCGRITKTKGVKHAVGPHATPIRISSVESFAVPL